MKAYQDVVQERFDQEEPEEQSIYAPDRPIGKYSRKSLFAELRRFLQFFSQEKSSITELSLLDMGCGSGGMLEFFKTQGFLSAHLYGADFSATRIKRAVSKYPEMSFQQADVTELDLDKKGFDLITSFDLFSHLSTEEQIIQGLTKVHEHLDDKGIFLWYDIHSDDHYSPPADAESWGFSKDQMIQLSEKAGFELVYEHPLFKKFFNRYHSIYQATRVPHGILSLLEKILPGTPGNLLMAFEKRTKSK